MFVRWKIVGLPRGTRQVSVVDALMNTTIVQTVAPDGFDSKGRLGVTVYFSSWVDGSPEHRASLVESYQAVLRDKLHQPSLIIEDITQR